MKRMTSVILAGAFIFAVASRLIAGPSESVDQARKLLAMNDGRAAVRVLEQALGEPGSQRQVIIGLLKRAYGLATDQAEAAGRKAEAEGYRDDLAVLSRVKTLAKAEGEPAPLAKLEPPAALAAEAPTPPPTPIIQRLPNMANDSPSLMTKASTVEESKPELVDTSAAGSVADGDAAYRAKNYAEASRIYADLMSKNQLPDSRKDQWAYCRWFAVVQKINAKPRTAAEWEAIDAEIEETKKLSPKNFFGEYLKQRAATRVPGLSKNASKEPTNTSDQVIIRGQTPEERPTPTPSPVLKPPPAKQSAPAPISVPASAPKTTATGQWKTRETTNFRILHADEGLADQVARVAEDIRAEQARKWSGASSPGPWTPRCDIYLYPTAQVFTQMTGQPGDSQGFSTMGVNDGRIIARRINLRVDSRGLVPAVLPHEVTHVVLADLFTSQQIPRWADEGMAVLSEPSSEQILRAKDLHLPLKSGRLFKMADLMVMDYPDGEHWGLYYAQSVSLTKFLVERGTPQQFVQFLSTSQRNGLEVELQRSYGFKNYQDLQDQWLTQARTGPSTMTAAGGSAAAVTRD